MGDVWDDLGFALYRRRLEIGISSQRELASRSGVSRNTISLIERGRPWSRRGTSWAKIEAVLELKQGWIAEFVSQHPARAARALSGETVERAVLDSIAEIAPQLTVRQARLIAQATSRRLEQDGLLGKPGD